MITTKFINAKYHNNRTTIIDLPKQVCLNNMRLIDVGCFRTGGDVSCSFPSSAGVLSVISSIALQDNGEDVCRLNNAYLWYAFMNTLGTNEVNKYINYSLAKNTNSYNMSDTETEALIGKEHTNAIPTVENDDGKAYVSLKKLLPFFASVGEQNLPFDLMKKPQLVIEYQQNLDWVFTVGAKPTSITITEPFLACDVIEDMESPKNMVLNYVSYENDRLVVPAVATDAKVLLKERYGAYNRKYINKMIVLNNVNSQALTTTNTTSLAQRGERIQLNINGQQHLPYQGIINSTDKAVMCDTTWGQRNIGTHQYGLGMMANNNLLLADSLLDSSAFSVFGCKVEKRIDTLELEYERVGDGADYNKEIALQTFAECPKTLSLTKGQVPIVSY
jgi:hypothetical protein